MHYSFQSCGLQISIHALREEGDVNHSESLFLSFDFYPRPPRGGRRFTMDDFENSHSISIHALREEGDLRFHDFVAPSHISIHALREEGDVASPG